MITLIFFEFEKKKANVETLRAHIYDVSIVNSFP